MHSLKKLCRRLCVLGVDGVVAGPFPLFCGVLGEAEYEEDELEPDPSFSKAIRVGIAIDDDIAAAR